MTRITRIPRVDIYTDLTPAQRRVAYLSNLNIKAPDRAKFAGVANDKLPEYIQGLVDLGLLDGGERITPAGAVLIHVSKGGPMTRVDGQVVVPLLTHRDLWRRIGGDETRLVEVIDHLIENKLIKAKGRGDERGYALAD